MATNLGLFIFCERVFFQVPVEAEALKIRFENITSLFSLTKNDPQVVQFIKCNVVAFLGANVLAYVLNFMWVFERGRHSRSLEIILFLSVSFFSFVVGTLLASVALHKGVHLYVAKSADIVTAIFVNYACRKWIVFKG